MWAYRSTLRPVEIHPALRSFADECTGVLFRLLAYIGALALIAIAGSRIWAALPVGDLAPSAKPAWSLAARSYPAFAVTQMDSYLKTATYDILRHPEGGRKDVLRWSTDPGDKPIAELEIYRPGAEARAAGPFIAEVASQMDPSGVREIQPAGVISSKFGDVALLEFAGRDADRPACLGFMKNLDDGHLRISGWSCQAGTPQVRRTAVGCILDHLILLTAGNEPKLAELFAHAELKRGACEAGMAPGAAADWVAGTQNPGLRGAL
jgi:hypothetical protein